MKNATIQLNIEGMDEKTILRYHEILTALISCGGLSGVKSGRTIIHFDKDGTFQGIELDYWPWRKRSKYE